MQKRGESYSNLETSGIVNSNLQEQGLCIEIAIFRCCGSSNLLRPTRASCKEDLMTYNYMLMMVSLGAKMLSSALFEAVLRIKM